MTSSHAPTPGDRVRVTLAYAPQYSRPIQVAAGERVSVGHEDDDFPGWKWCKAADESEGWMPIELLSGDGDVAVVMEDYSSRELAVEPGEEVVVEDSRRDWLLVRNGRGERGWIPPSRAA